MQRGAGAAVARGVAVLLFATAQCAAAEVSVVDDTGATVTLAAPARRIVSLAPHVTELLFAAGAGERIVGAVEFSDYPEAAKAIPRIGSSTLLDMEQILALKPDLVVVWRSGTAPARIEALRASRHPDLLQRAAHVCGYCANARAPGQARRQRSRLAKGAADA